MAKTETLELNIVAASEETKSFLAFRQEIAGDGDNSNMVIIDKAIGGLMGALMWLKLE